MSGAEDCAGDKGVFERMGLKGKDKPYRLVAGTYLKQLMKVREQWVTLDISSDQ